MSGLDALLKDLEEQTGQKLTRDQEKPTGAEAGQSAQKHAAVARQAPRPADVEPVESSQAYLSDPMFGKPSADVDPEGSAPSEVSTARARETYDPVQRLKRHWQSAMLRALTGPEDEDRDKGAYRPDTDVSGPMKPGDRRE